jgi:hypothetical protein
MDQLAVAPSKADVYTCTVVDHIATHGMFAGQAMTGVPTMPWHLFCGLFIDRYPNLTRPLILSSPYKPILHRGHSNLRGAGDNLMMAINNKLAWISEVLPHSGFSSNLVMFGVLNSFLLKTGELLSGQGKSTTPTLMR